MLDALLEQAKEAALQLPLFVHDIDTDRQEAPPQPTTDGELDPPGKLATRRAVACDQHAQYWAGRTEGQQSVIARPVEDSPGHDAAHSSGGGQAGVVVGQSKKQPVRQVSHRGSYRHQARRGCAEFRCFIPERPQGREDRSSSAPDRRNMSAGSAGRQGSHALGPQQEGVGDDDGAPALGLARQRWIVVHRSANTCKPLQP